MKFIDFLQATEWFDGELITKHCGGLESKFSFCWSNRDRFTDYGKEKFAAILQSEIAIHTLDAGRCSVITLLSEEITEEKYDLFMAMVAGYVAQTFYDLVMEKVEEED